MSIYCGEWEEVQQESGSRLDPAFDVRRPTLSLGSFVWSWASYECLWAVLSSWAGKGGWQTPRHPGWGTAWREGQNSACFPNCQKGKQSQTVWTLSAFHLGHKMIWTSTKTSSSVSRVLWRNALQKTSSLWLMGVHSVNRLVIKNVLVYLPVIPTSVGVLLKVSFS